MKTVFLILSLLILVSAVAQKKGDKELVYYTYDKEWNPCDLEKAVFLAVVQEVADTAYQWSYYNFKGPLLAIETYREEEKKTPHGYFAWFDKNGLIDSSGQSFNGKKHGSWLYFTDSLSLWQSEKYDRGSLLERKDRQLLKEERQKNDSIGLLPGDKEASFKGGDKAWIKYLQANLNMPSRAESLNIQGRVNVYFMVDVDGTLKNIRIWKSVEYSLDEEAFRLIRTSPRWQPAVQLERNVQAYRVQPFTFSL